MTSYGEAADADQVGLDLGPDPDLDLDHGMARPRRPTWSAPVRFAEVDAQGIVFNSHYLVFADEAMNAFLAERGLEAMARRVRVVTTTATWRGPARWGDTVQVAARCARVGRTSVVMEFDISVAAQTICHVETTYVNAGPRGRPAPVSARMRTLLCGQVT